MSDDEENLKPGFGQMQARTTDVFAASQAYMHSAAYSVKLAADLMASVRHTDPRKAELFQAMGAALAKLALGVAGTAAELYALWQNSYPGNSPQAPAESKPASAAETFDAIEKKLYPKGVN